VLTPLALKAGWFATSVAVVEPAATMQTDEAAFTKLLIAKKNPDPLATGGGEITAEDGALTASGQSFSLDGDTVKRSSNEISVYVVREGDSLSQIAEMYGVTSNTIKWANDIASSNGIQPGDTLVILPIAGVQHEVAEGDTLASIIDEYDADTDEVLAFNGLTEDSVLTVGDEIMIPGGELHSAPVAGATYAASNGGGGSLSHPVPGALRTQGIHGYNAVDLAAGHGTAIRAAGSGEVIVAKASGWNGGYGNYVVIRHANGVQTLYAHLSSVSVGVGTWVNAGATIGAMGNTGRSTGTHLHFEVRGGYNPF